MISKIKAADGKEFDGFLTCPDSGSGPGLLLIQEIFGVNSHIREVAELYAREGFVVLAPDLFWRVEPNLQLGYGENDFKKGFSIYQKLDINQTIADLASAVEALRKLSGVTNKVGSLGFCLGGHLSYRLATHNKVDAAICYYGGSIDQALGEAANIACPMLMHFGEIDDYIPPTAIEAIRQALASKPNVSIYVYRGAHHGFNCNQRPSFDYKSAMLAYARSAKFLHQQLEYKP